MTSYEEQSGGVHHYKNSQSHFKQFC